MEENASSFADDTDTHCDFSIADHISDTENANDIYMSRAKIPRRSLTKKTHIQKHFWQCTHTVP